MCINTGWVSTWVEIIYCSFQLEWIWDDPLSIWYYLENCQGVSIAILFLFSLKWNSHNKIDFLKFHSFAVSIFTVLFNHFLCLVSKHFITPKIRLCTHEAVIPHSFFSYIQAANHLLLFLWIYLFCLFHIHGMIH